MFSKQLKDYAENTYQKRLPFFGRRKAKIEQSIKNCSPDEQILMKFLYGTMPLRDAGEYDFSVFYSYVSHSLYLRKNMEWCRDIPEELFLHYILYYRVNSETIEDCRSFFCRQILPRIKGLSAKEAALEINYWCGENGSYESSDSRTISPLTMYRSGKGRCGEESVFAVTAFRSVGIPARQVYTPRWAHCDDNHAWVEVYVEGKWHFLGACEPEEILNKGWFSHASSRALFVHSLTFSDYTGNSFHVVTDYSNSTPSIYHDYFSDERIGREGQVLYYNRTAFYAKTKKLEILVLDSKEHPISYALVLVEILNMAEYSSAASLFTNENGKASITLGLGSVHLHVEKENCWTETTVFTGDVSQVILHLPASSTVEKEFLTQNKDCWKEFIVQAPGDFPVHPASLTREQKRKNQQRLKEAEKIRENRIQGYFQEDLAQNYPCEREILRAAAGNFQEIYAFLSKDESPDRRALLHDLSIKDYKDATAKVLESHLEKAFPFGELWEKQGKREIYVHYLLCPRIYLEELTDYRGYIQDYFTEEQKKQFFRHPEEIWKYIKNTMQNHAEMDYKTLCSTPKGCLELSHGNALSQKILFVAICRTLGIPSRINPVTLEAEWYNRNGFISVTVREKIERPAILMLYAEEDCPWQYYQHWTIGHLVGCQFTTLDYTGKRIAGGKIELLLAPGTYRLLTANRLPDGSQRAGEYVFDLESGQKKEIQMQQRPIEFKDMLVNYQLEDFEVNINVPSCSRIAAQKVSSLINREVAVIAFLQEGQEPTEHVLNELLEQGKDLWELGVQILFILQSSEALNNETLKRVLTQFPQIQSIYGDFDELAEPIARRMYIEPEKYPLLVVIQKNLEAIYGHCGYRVGIIGLLEQIIRCVFVK